MGQVHVSSENTVGDLQGAVGAEGRVARRGERKNSRQRPPISLHRGLGPLDDQRIAIPRGLGDEARLREARIIAELRYAEIDENGLVGLHHDVGGLEITVQNPGRVDGEDRLAQILSQLDQFPFGEPAAFVDVVLADEAVDRLRAAAGTIIVDSPEFKRLLKDAGGTLVPASAAAPR